MGQFRDLIEAKNKDLNVYIEDGTLWVAYGQGSGTTTYNIDMKKYMNDDKADKEHYDDIVRKIKEFAFFTKPMKAKGDSSLYEIPVYGKSEYGKTLDVWGGDVKPIKKAYMIVTEEKSTIVNFFVKKNEALAWIKSIA